MDNFDPNQPPIDAPFLNVTSQENRKSRTGYIVAGVILFFLLIFCCLFTFGMIYSASKSTANVNNELEKALLSITLTPTPTKAPKVTQTYDYEDSRESYYSEDYKYVKEDGKIAEAVYIDGLSITIKSVSNYIPKDSNLIIEGYKFISFDIEFENKEDIAVYPASSSFTLRDSDEFIYNTSDIRMPNIKYSTLRNGQKIRGFVTFQVPNNAKDFKIIYTSYGLTDHELVSGINLPE